MKKVLLLGAFMAVGAIQGADILPEEDPYRYYQEVVGKRALDNVADVGVVNECLTDFIDRLVLGNDDASGTFGVRRLIIDNIGQIGVLSTDDSVAVRCFLALDAEEMSGRSGSYNITAAKDAIQSSKPHLFAPLIFSVAAVAA